MHIAPAAIALALFACPCTALRAPVAVLTTSRAAASAAWAGGAATHLQIVRFTARGLRMQAEGSSSGPSAGGAAPLPAAANLLRVKPRPSRTTDPVFLRERFACTNDEMLRVESRLMKVPSIDPA